MMARPHSGHRPPALAASCHMRWWSPRDRRTVTLLSEDLRRVQQRIGPEYPAPWSAAPADGLNALEGNIMPAQGRWLLFPSPILVLMPGDPLLAVIPSANRSSRVASGVFP